MSGSCERSTMGVSSCRRAQFACARTYVLIVQQKPRWDQAIKYAPPSPGARQGEKIAALVLRMLQISTGEASSASASMLGDSSLPSQQDEPSPARQGRGNLRPR